MLTLREFIRLVHATVQQWPDVADYHLAVHPINEEDVEVDDFDFSHVRKRIIFYPPPPEDDDPIAEPEDYDDGGENA